MPVGIGGIVQLHGLRCVANHLETVGLKAVGLAFKEPSRAKASLWLAIKATWPLAWPPLSRLELRWA